MDHFENDQIIALLEIANHIDLPKSSNAELATALIYCRDPELIFSDTAAINLRTVHECAKRLFDQITVLSNESNIFPTDETKEFAKKFLHALRRRDEYNDQMKLEKF